MAGLTLALAHGVGKLPPTDPFVARVASMGLPAPGLFAWLAALGEFGGGLLLALGLLTRAAAIVVGGGMLVTVALAHAGDPFSAREAAVLFLAIGVLYALAGPGRYSLDAMLFRGARGGTGS